MPNKKVIFAIVLFVVSGLLVYSFASPDNEPTPNDDKKPVVEENENNDKNQNDNDDNTSGDVVVGDTDTNNDTTDNVNVTPVVVVPVNYDSLETAVNNSEEIINSEIVEDYLVDLLEELGDVTEEAKTILEARNATQETVDNQTNVINGLINQINNIVDNKLKESRSSGETLLVSNTGDDEKPKNDALNNLLNQLKNNIEDEEIESKPLPQRLNYINNVNRLINDVETLQTELNIIEQAQITLTPSTSSWTNKDVILLLNIDIKDESLIESKQFFKNDEEIEENNNSAIADENATYKVLVNFTNGESKYSNEVVVNNIDREAPIANLRIEYSSIDGNIYGKNIVVIGEVDASEKNIKSHWFEITNPDKSLSYVHNLNTNDLTYSFNLDTSKGSGQYKIRYVATDRAGNRNDDPNGKNSAIKTITVDAINPETTIEVSEVVNGKFTVSGKAIDDNRLNRVYVQLVDRNTNQRCGGTTINLLTPNQKEAEWSVDYDIRTLKVVGSTENCSMDGNYAAHVTVVDNLGNSSSSGWTNNFFVANPIPKTTIKVSEVVNERFTISGKAIDEDRLNRVYIQLIDRNTNQRCGGTTINLLTPNQKEAEWSVDYDVRTLKIVGSTESCSMEGNYAAHVTVVDNFGNSSSAGWTENFLVDVAAPRFTVKGNPNNWINSDVELVIDDIIEKGSGLHTEPYSFDDGQTWQAENKAIFSENQTVKIKVRDLAGNESETYTVNIEKIDTTNPSIPTIVSSSNGMWTNKPVLVSWESEDTLSGISHYEYSFDGVNWQTTNEKSMNFNETQRRTLYVRAVDRANNKSEVVSTLIEIELGVMYVSNLAELNEALLDVSINTIILTNNIEIDKQVKILRPVTINGNNNQIIVTKNLGTNNSEKHSIGIYSNNVTINNLTVNNKKKAYGVQAYKVNGVYLNNITILNSSGAGLTVNGSTVYAHNLNVDGSSLLYGSVDVTPGSGVTTPSVFYLTGNGKLKDLYRIYSDTSDKQKVFVYAEGYKETFSIFRSRLWSK